MPRNGRNCFWKRKGDFFYALAEHRDDCRKILLCFFAANGECNQNPVVEEFLSQTPSYRRHIGNIVNHMKHEHGRLRAVAFFGDLITLPGYFCESVNDSEGIGPNPKIHAGGNTAFSFARDLRYHFENFFFVFHHLSVAVHRISGQFGTSENIQGDPWIAITARRLRQLTNFCFPDEGSEPRPWVEIRTVADQSDDQLSLALVNEFESACPIKTTVLGRIRFSTAYAGDGVTRSFQMLYHGWDGENWPVPAK